MVDPDNRRPVDWDQRRETLAALDSGAPVDRANVKMHLIRRTLALRARRPEPFAGAYRPLAADGPLCAFARGDDEILAVAAVREDAAGATFRLPDGTAGKWRDVLAGSGPDGGRTLDLGPEVSFDQVRLPGWPVALLERGRPGGFGGPGGRSGGGAGRRRLAEGGPGLLMGVLAGCDPHEEPRT
jgi:(1->4)-alpha-D-glucan 1-alpha-D-glucosylmutase